LLAALPAARRIGIEVNEPAAAAARRRGIEVVRGSVDLDDSIADVVISKSCSRANSPFEELCGLNRALKPNGRLVLWLPLDDWRVQRRASRNRDHHLYTWTPFLLGNLLLEADFEVRECRVVTRAWPPFASGLCRLPRPALDICTFAWSVVRRRRQLVAVATPFH
jgi:SAM-dependent methyltransferase